MSTAEDIKARLDILDLVSQYVPLQQSGASYRARCPFHTEKTPSFFVFPNRQSWRCFGACATGGDVFSFFMRMESVDFSQALRQLAQRTGVDLSARPSSQRNDPLYRINEAASQFFSRRLASSEGRVALDYLKERGLTQETIDLFQLGLSPGDGHSLKRHLLSLDHSEDQLVLAGLMSQTREGGHQDLFRRRLIFPIWDLQGRLVGFGGRALDNSSPKYLNSRQGPVFDKGRTLYAYHLAQQSIKEMGAVVVEGYMDAIVAHQEGFPNVVASMGTSLTRHQAALLRKAQEVVLALDPDTAGQEATRRSLESSWQVLQQVVVSQSREATLYERPAGPNLKVASLPQGMDPDEIILEDPARWERLTREAAPLMEFLFKALSVRFDLSTAQGKKQAAEMLFPLVAATPDTFEQDRHFQDLAQLLGVSEATLEASVGRRPPRKGPSTPRGDTAASTPFQSLEHDPLEEHCLALVLQNSRLASMASALRPEHFQRIENREVFTNWLKGSKIELLDQEISAHFAYLTGKTLLPSDLREKDADLAHCMRRLEERRLRRLKEEEGLCLAHMDLQEINQHQREILDINSKMEALFRSGIE